MAATITRTINVYQVRAIAANFKTKSFETVASAVIECTAPNNQLARRAFKERGFGVPRGCEMDWEIIDSATYECSIEDFMSIAHKVEKPSDNEDIDA